MYSISNFALGNDFSTLVGGFSLVNLSTSVSEYYYITCSIWLQITRYVHMEVIFEMDFPPKNIETRDTVSSSMAEMIKGLQKPPKATGDNDLAWMNDALRDCAMDIKYNFDEKLLEMDPLEPEEMIRLSNSCLKLLSHFPFDTDSLYLSVKKFVIEAHELACAKENVDLEKFGEMDFPLKNIETRDTVSSSMVEMIKGLQKPPKPTGDNDLAWMNDALRFCAQDIKHNFVEKLLEMDPLAPQEMIRLSNSCLKLLSHFPFDTHSLYLSVKEFIVAAHVLECAKAAMKDAKNITITLSPLKDRCK